ncbi:MAG: site-2 protease family protein [Acutalibacteraceae bacterium]|jgi:stage IV sporulation protein FB
MFEMRLGRLHIGVNVLFPASLLTLMLLDGGQTALWSLAASLMHESGHVIALLWLEKKPVGVTLGAFGMRIRRLDTAAFSYRRQTAVLLAGPAVNLICAALLALGGKTGVACAVHAAIGLFNLLPVEPLDGGQILLCLLAARGGLPRAERAVFCLSLAVLFALLAAGFTLLLLSGYNFTLLAVAVYLALLIFLQRRK